MPKFQAQRSFLAFLFRYFASSQQSNSWSMILDRSGDSTPRTQKITSAVLAIWLAGMRGWAAFGRSVGEEDRMADHDLIITHKDLFDQQAHDLLAIEDVESMQRSPEPAEECGEWFGETEIGSAVGRLIGDRLQFAARGLFTLA